MKKKYKNKVAIVVDHPSRDLPPIIQISKQFLKLNYEVYIIPYYKLDFFIYKIRNFDLDFIVFNFFRNSILEKIKFIKSHGISAIILDQEPVAGYDGLGLNKSFKDKRLIENFKMIDHYFFSGKKIMDNCLKKLSKNQRPRNNHLLGYHRFNIKNKEFNNINLKDFILISTNFPSNNPRFIKNDYNSLHKETKINNSNYDKMIHNKFLNQKNFQIQEYKNLIKDLLDRYPNELFVLRPHPFENHKYWKDNLLNKKNLIISNEYNSIEWIKKCKLLLHLDCTTSIEALFLGKNSISPKWILNYDLSKYFKLVNYSSHFSNNKFEFFKLFNYLLLNSKKNLLKKNLKNLSYYFGNYSITSTNKIFKNLINNKKNNEKYFKVDLGYKFKIKCFIFFIFGEKVFNFFVGLINGFYIKRSRSVKNFDEKMVKNYLSSDNYKVFDYKYFFHIF